MAKSGARVGANPVYGAAIPLSEPIKLDRDHLLRELRSIVGLAGARVRMLEGEEERKGLLAGLLRGPQEFNFEIAGVRLTIISASRPLCSASTMHSFINPAIWRSGASGMTNHRAHLLIAEPEGRVSGADAMFDRATAVTLAAAAVANMVQAEGVVWLPSRNALPMSTFGSEMERFIDGQAPLQFWVRTQILPAPVQEERELGALTGEALNPGVATVGLTAFIGAEIIAPPSHCEREMMLDHIYALASSVIDENVKLQDDTVYGSPGEPKVCLHKRAAGLYSERPYWELLPRPAAAAKGTAPGQQSGGQSEGGGHERHLRLVSPGN